MLPSPPTDAYRCWCCQDATGRCPCHDLPSCPACTYCERHCRCSPAEPVQADAAPARWDRLPPHALLRITAALPDDGGPWRRQSRRDHVNRALESLFAHLAGDQPEDNLVRAACRLLFALEVRS